MSGDQEMPELREQDLQNLGNFESDSDDDDEDNADDDDEDFGNDSEEAEMDPHQLEIQKK